MKTAIYITNGSISHSDYDNLELDYLQQSGLEVRVCMYCKKEEYTTFDATNNPEFIGPNFDLIHSYRKFENYICRHSSNAVFLLETGHGAAVWYVMAKYNCSYIVLGPRSGHPVDLNIPIEDFIFIQAKEPGFAARMLNYVLHPGTLLSKFANIKRDRLGKLDISEIVSSNPPVCVTVDTQHDIDCCLQPYFKTQDLLFVPSVDYNKYLLQIRQDSSISEQYILYVHSGILFTMRGCPKSGNIQNPFDDEYNRRKYMENLERLFEMLEDHYQLPVVISSHPNVNFQGYTFGDRRIVYGNTCQMVKDCNMYLGPASTAASFAVLFNKRLLIIYNEVEKQSVNLRFRQYYQPLLSELGISGGNLDDEEFMRHPWDYAPFIEEGVRAAYIDKYLRNPATDDKRTLGEILKEKIENV